MPSQTFNDHAVENLVMLMMGDNQYIIPFSQRNFSWETKDTKKTKNLVGSLWDSLLLHYSRFRTHQLRQEKLKLEIGTETDPAIKASLQKEVQTINPSKIAERFVGPMVFVQPTQAEPIFEVVDGQQRLTTLTMILCIIRDLTLAVSDVENGKPKTTVPLSKIIELTEIRENNDEHKQWRLQPNSIDKQIFNQVVLPYESVQHKKDVHEGGNSNKPEPFTDTSTQPGKPFLQIKEKLAYFKTEIEKHDNAKPKSSSPYDGRESNIRIMKAYRFLHQKIIDSLLTDFAMSEAQVEKTKDQLKEKYEDKTNLLLHVGGEISNPETGGKYGVVFDPADFFNAPREGLDWLQHRFYSKQDLQYKEITWEDEDKEIIEQQYTKYKANPKHEKSIEEWLAQKIETRESKYTPDYLNGETFLKVKNDLIASHENDYLRTMIKEKLPDLYNFVQHQVYLSLYNVRITVQDLEIASDIFETLNSKGEPLTKANLVKNHILGYFTQNQSELEKLAKRWDDVIKDAGSGKADEFLRESLRSRGKEERIENGSTTVIFDNFNIESSIEPVSIKEETLYSIIKEKIFNETTASKYITELEEDIILRKKLDDPTNEIRTDDEGTHDTQKIKAALYFLQILGGEYIRIPILTAWRHWGTPESSGEPVTWKNTTDEFILLVKFLVLFFFKWKSIRGQSATTIDTLMPKLCEFIQNSDPADKHKVLDSIIKFLSQYDDDNDFKNQLKKYSMKPDKTYANLMLNNLSMDLGNDLADMEPSGKLTVEHVLPENPEEETGSGTGWSKSDFFTDYTDTELDAVCDYFKDETLPNIPKEYDNFKSRLGNFTLLTQKINSAIGNKGFQVKKYHFEDTKDETLKVKSCTLAGDSTQTPTIPPCPGYVDAPQLFAKNPNCTRHGTPNGLNASLLKINTDTVLQIEGTSTKRTNWTAKAILERTQFLVTRLILLYKLPKVFCETQSCPNKKKGDFWNMSTKKIELGKVDEAKCPECHKPLHVWWPPNNAKIFRAPDSRHAQNNEEF